MLKIKVKLKKLDTCTKCGEELTEMYTNLWKDIVVKGSRNNPPPIMCGTCIHYHLKVRAVI